MNYRGVCRTAPATPGLLKIEKNILDYSHLEKPRVSTRIRKSGRRSQNRNVGTNVKQAGKRLGGTQKGRKVGSSMLT